MDSSRLFPLIANSWNVTPSKDDIFGQSVSLRYTFLPGGELPFGQDPVDQLMVIVPRGQALEIEALVFNRDIGFVVEGQKATVKVDAFPFTRYGTIAGDIVTVNKDAATDEKLGLVYPSRDPACYDADAHRCEGCRAIAWHGGHC